jgi:hypothetical protein
MQVEELFPLSLPNKVGTPVVAAALGMSLAGVRGLIKRGVLPRPLQTSPRGRYLFSTSSLRESVAKMLEEGAHAAAE